MAKIKHRAIIVIDIEYDTDKVTKQELLDNVPSFIDTRMDYDWTPASPYQLTNCTFYANIHDFLLDNQDGCIDAVDIVEVQK